MLPDLANPNLGCYLTWLTLTWDWLLREAVWPKRPPWEPWEVPRDTTSKRRWTRPNIYTNVQRSVTVIHSPTTDHAETNSTHHRDRSTDDDGARLPSVAARLYAGGTVVHRQGEGGTFRQTDVEKKPQKGDKDEETENDEGFEEESLRPERHHQGSKRDTGEKEYDVEESRSKRVVGKESVVGVAEKERQTDGRTVFEQENDVVESDEERTHGQETTRRRDCQ